MVRNLKLFLLQSKSFYKNKRESTLCLKPSITIKTTTSGRSPYKSSKHKIKDIKEIVGLSSKLWGLTKSSTPCSLETYLPRIELKSPNPTLCEILKNMQKGTFWLKSMHLLSWESLCTFSVKHKSQACSSNNSL